MNHSKPKLVFLTGAGISAESGIQTFRGTDGLWENHRVEDVATPEAWNNDPELVLRFYNERRRKVLDARPNLAHQTIVQLESDFDVHSRKFLIDPAPISADLEARLERYFPMTACEGLPSLRAILLRDVDQRPEFLVGTKL